MKIGIFTFHCAHNYGAILQAFALQEYIRDLGHDVYIIDYRPKYLTDLYKVFNFSKCTNVRNFIREFLTMPIRIKRAVNFRRFVHRRLRLYELDLSDEYNDFDAFIYGSDQIWNPTITNGFDDVYFGKVPATTGKRLIAYAASVGSINQLRDADKVYLKNALSRFSVLSVRESDLQLFLKGLGIDSQCVCDPVLLAGREVFDRICGNSPTSLKGYLLLFQLEIINEAIRKDAKSMAVSRGLNIVEVISRRETFSRSILQTLSPESFLSCLRSASYILTTSFHGTVFSLLYSKQFNTIKTSDAVDARAKEILSYLGLENRLIMSGNYDDGSISYDDVDKRLFEYVNNSRCFIRNKINGFDNNTSI